MASGSGWVVHRVNCDHVQAIDRFIPVVSFDRTLDVGDLPIAPARFFDFEAGTVTSMPVERLGNEVTVTISSLQVCSIVELLP